MISDYDLCIAIASHIEKKYGLWAKPLDFTDEERPVIVVLTIDGIIGNGGFDCLFESIMPGDPDYMHVLNSFEKIKCFKALEIIKKVLCHFPNSLPPQDDEERLRIWKRVPRRVRSKLDDEFYAESENIIRCLAEYIRINNLSA